MNYPLDVYYLMDFSYSMKGDLDELKLLTEEISKCFFSWLILLYFL